MKERVELDTQRVQELMRHQGININDRQAESIALLLNLLANIVVHQILDATRKIEHDDI